ncbi:MAG: FAD-binding protein [Tyzzerella sp.]|nr:FAD-binding protein [Tyzzerella sp.]
MGIKVLIVGKGLTGLMAAWQLLEKTGSAELEIEIVSDGSGASPYVHGFNVPLHPNDTVDIFKQDTMDGGYGLSNSELVKYLCEDSEDMPALLERLQVFLEKKDGQYKLLKPLGSTWPRVAGSGNHTGAEIMNRLDALLKSRKEVCFTASARVLRLDVQDGSVRGAVLWNKKKEEFEYREADIVMLASGGFCGIYPFSTNMPDSGGDGIAMAFEAGAVLTDMEFIQFEPSVALYPEGVRSKSVITTMFYEGAVLRNGKNERFMKPEGSEGPGECVGKDTLAKAIYREMQEGTPTEHGGVYFDATGVGAEKLMESYASYVDRYKKVGVDITKEPFEIAPGAHTSLGGVVVNTNCETNIKGLFAAGEIIGGLHGANRVGGNAGLETLVFGKRAADGMYKYFVEADVKNFRDQNTNEAERISSLIGKENEAVMNPEEIIEIREKMEKLLQNNLFVIRNGADLEKAVASIEEMEAYVKTHSCHQNPYGKLRLENDLICATLLAHAALARTESVGCHVRKDSDEGDYKYNVMLQKDNRGKRKLWKESLKEEK